MAIYAVFLNWDMEHLACTGAVNVAATLEYLLPPHLTGIPSDNAGFDGAEIGNIELSTFLRNEGCPDQLREGVRDIFI